MRDRASYEFAIASTAVALELEADHVVRARIGLGGMAYRPWRAEEAEEVLTGKPLTDTNAQAAAEAALMSARSHGQNDYKPELARRMIVRALLQAKSLQTDRGGSCKLKKKLFGRPTSRIDGVAKVTGSARYASDERVANPAFAYLVTSAIARGKIGAFKLEHARAVPGRARYSHPRERGRSNQTGRWTGWRTYDQHPRK